MKNFGSVDHEKTSNFLCINEWLWLKVGGILGIFFTLKDLVS